MLFLFYVVVIGDIDEIGDFNGFDVFLDIYDLMFLVCVVIRILGNCG